MEYFLEDTSRITIMAKRAQKYDKKEKIKARHILIVSKDGKEKEALEEVTKIKKKVTSIVKLRARYFTLVTIQYMYKLTRIYITKFFIISSIKY